MSHPLAPDLVAVQAEALFAPWPEGMRLDGPPDAMLDPKPARRAEVVKQVWNCDGDVSENAAHSQSR